MILLCALACSCASTKKVSQSIISTRDSVQTDFGIRAKTEKVIDTTKVNNSKIIITEIEFYPPTTNVESTSNVGQTIKKFKQTFVKSNSEQKGECMETSNKAEDKREVIVANSHESTQMESTPVPDPYRWRYILAIVVILLACVFYLRKNKLIEWVKKVVANIKDKFKKV